MKHSGANSKNEDTTSPDDEPTITPQRSSRSDKERPQQFDGLSAVSLHALGKDAFSDIIRQPHETLNSIPCDCYLKLKVDIEFQAEIRIHK